ncbi:hypothetical protein RA991_22695, partial [Mycobacteroides abscessus subsp. massiliense]|uniref:hypothetical protein n=1 Tax=Mycobacteroides abscessus TaxID=36809 RepID=UPI003CF565EB
MNDDFLRKVDDIDADFFRQAGVGCELSLQQAIEPRDKRIVMDGALALVALRLTEEFGECQ